MHKILVLDDNADLAAVLNLILRQYGYVVKGSTEPCRIFCLCREFNPHIIFLNIMLPELDERYLCRQLKNNRETYLLPVILFSARNNLIYADNNCRNDGFITEPLETCRLVTVLNHQLACRE